VPLKCLICDGYCNMFVDNRLNINYYECSECQFIMKSIENFSDFSEQKERYNLHNNHEEDRGYQAYFQRFIDFLELEDRESIEQALDFGCGATLLLSKMLQNHHMICDTYDPIYHPNEAYKERSYDLITSVEVFEHLHNPKSIFAHLLQRLNSRGYLALQTALHPNDREAFLKWYYRLDPTHVIFFSLHTFEVLADMFALEIIRSDNKSKILFQK